MTKYLLDWAKQEEGAGDGVAPAAEVRLATRDDMPQVLAMVQVSYHTRAARSTCRISTTAENPILLFFFFTKFILPSVTAHASSGSARIELVVHAKQIQRREFA